MMILLAGVFLLLLFASPVFRCALLRTPSVVLNAVLDIFAYFRYRKGNECRTGEIVAFCGLFGKGKTLSMVHRVTSLYKKYDGKKIYDAGRKIWVTQRVHVISNVALSIPYSEFVSLQQVVDAAEKRQAYDAEHGTRTITIVAGDEFSVQMNSRSFKTNLNPLLLNTILTCRHHYISLYYTAQRFGHVDALLRQVTSYVVDCDKLWRFQRNYRYDAWEMENATNVMLLKPFRRECWFVRNRDFKAYDTLACVGNLVKSWTDSDMLTEEEILALQQGGDDANTDGILKPSRKLKKMWKKKRG